MSGEERRGQYLDHPIKYLSVYLREYLDGSIEFEGSSSNYRTDDDDDYEYTLTIEAGSVGLMGAALGLGQGADIYSAIVHRSVEIVRRGESSWMTERNVPFEFFAWAPWARRVPDEEMDP